MQYMIRYLFFFCLIGVAQLPGSEAFAQKTTTAHKTAGAQKGATQGGTFTFPSEDRAELLKKEDSLVILGRKFVNEEDVSSRFQADSQFTRTLVRALKVPNSFRYPFDSLETVSHIYAPDSSFRIYTWQVTVDENNYRRHGAIQMRTPDGSLKLFGLIDRSSVINHPMDTVTSNEYWIGNIYYKIVEKKFKGKNFYTLLGYDEYSFSSTRKWIEVLTFDTAGKPVFGGPYFSFTPGDTAVPHGSISRFMLEFKKDGNARVQYDPDLDLILYDHLVSESNEPAKTSTLIPDGDYEGFRWANGKWVHINKVFTQKLQEGQAPVPTPLTKEPGGH